MPVVPPKRPRPVVIALVVACACGFAVVVAELFLRVFIAAPRALGQLTYAGADGQPLKFDEALAQGRIVPVPQPVPRGRLMFGPGERFFLCYSDPQKLHRDWLDERGRVGVRINQFGLREREEITPDKPPGQRRIVCVGDSFTFGWGIPEERGWVRRLEDELRKTSGDVRTVNCGAAGTVCIDEYWFGLQHRFHVFQPDAAILTICLNDLIPSSGLNFEVPPQPTGVRVVDLVRGALGRRPDDLDPNRDWAQELLDLPADQAIASGLATSRDPPLNDKPFDAMWSQGVPQSSLRAAKAWCDSRKIPFLVVLWPFLQGLGPGRWYPYQKLHDLVAADCAAAGIPFHDVLPALRTTPAEELWVTPADKHANPRSQELVLPGLVAFVRQHTKW
jgi:hypothetical protein